ncbi:hypothetical protein QBC38DRAFT_406401 [Podospora fimiseda]|uniref:MOSC domain-containing protein n=1 Tax=Podospora fimiseda TaxID=252190 RepID=A0AAN7BYX8_9PEZI|nr:hypothetical protein QBC38DRAFT_406401 [Podospora fimiseda]
MRITSLHLYPIKALRGISLQQAQITPKGIKHDRTFILYEVRSQSSSEPPTLKKMQLDSHPKCALFQQQIDHSTHSIKVIHLPSNSTLTIPLEPDISTLTKIQTDLHGSTTQAYSMADPYDSWFSAHFNIPVKFIYIGDGKRPVLGKTLPPLPPLSTAPENKGWFSYLTGSSSNTKPNDGPYITFTDVAPLLITSESSLKDVSNRLPEENRPMPMYKFRPNVVLDGEGEQAWAEDYWAELTVSHQHKLAMTGNCVRCISLNVDYETGKPAEGEMGTVLKKLMKDRRVDAGSKWSPVFGRYGFPLDEQEFIISVGGEVEVTKRNSDRTVWDWPGL